MTDATLIQTVINDPLVKERGATSNPDGTVRPATPAELQTRATQNLVLAVGMILTDQAIVRSIRESTYTLTLTAATDYDLPAYVGRPINVRAAVNERPLTILASADEYDRYMADHYPSPDTGTIQAIYANRDAISGNWHVTLIPGPGVSGSLLIRYIYRPFEPYSLLQLPPELHPLVTIMVLNRMTGGALKEDVTEAKKNAQRALGGAAASVSVQKYPESTQWRLRRINSGSSALQRPSWLGYGP